MTTVSFDEIKEKVTLKMVLQHYKVFDTLTPKETQKGTSHRGPCPFCKAKGTAFSASLEKNAFRCFSCPAKGNVLNFTALMKGYEGEDAIRKAALHVADVFHIESKDPPSTISRDPEPTEAMAPGRGDDTAETPQDAPTEEIPANPVLTFPGLKNISHRHEALEALDVAEETLRLYGVGYYSGKGMQRNRIVFPIHNLDGGLVAYGGVSPDEPGRYHYPDQGKFRKDLELFGAYQAAAVSEATGLILVEHPFDVLVLSSAGFQYAAAYMDTTISDEQIELVRQCVGKHGNVTLVVSEASPDAEEIISRLIPDFHVRLVWFPDPGARLTSFAPRETKLLLG